MFPGQVSSIAASSVVSEMIFSATEFFKLFFNPKMSKFRFDNVCLSEAQTNKHKCSYKVESLNVPTVL